MKSHYSFTRLAAQAFLLLIVLLASSAQMAAFAAGGIRGTISDSKKAGIPGASIQLLNTTNGAAADQDGAYVIGGLAPGAYVLKVSAVGYLPKNASVVVQNDVVTVNLTLSEDVLQLQDVVVTGGTGIKKIESSTAITTLSAKELQVRSPLYSADLFRAIPGLQVESYGGNGPGNVIVRGFPQSGGYAFLGVMEDGLPVVPTTTSRNVSPDIYFKVDYTLRNVEAVRGGNASMLMPNSAGAVVNNISYTGAEKTYGKFGITRGVPQNLNRVDGNLGGSLSKNILYNIGGFYRTDEGIISPGFVGTKGGQLKANMTYLFGQQDGTGGKGFVRVYGKYLNDKVYWGRQSFYQYDGSGKAVGTPQYDLFTQTLVPQETKIDFTLPDGTAISRDYKDGMHPIVSYGGVQFRYQTKSGWEFNNNFRYSSTKFSNVALGFTSVAPYGTTRKYYSLDGTPLAVNPTDYSMVLTYNITDGTDKQTIDFLDVRKTVGKHDLSLGLSAYNVAVDYLQMTATGTTEFKDNPQRLLVNKTTGSDITSSATTQQGALQPNRGTTLTTSAYAQDEILLNPSLRLNLGVRVDNNNITGENPVFGGTATNATPAGKGYFISGYAPFNTENHTYYSLTAGANQKLNENFALFGRITKSYNALSIYDITTLGYNADLIKTRGVLLGEAGVRYGKSNFALFGSLVYSSVKNVSLLFFVPTNTGSTVRYPAFGSTSTISGEVEASYRPLDKLGFRLISTVQNAKYTDFVFSAGQDVRDDIKGKTYDWTGNAVESVPNISSELTTTLTLKHFNASLIVAYMGKRYTSAANTVTMAAYTTLNAAVGYRFTKQLTFDIHGYNITNTRGLVAGDVRGDQFVVPSTLVTGKILPGAAIFPRNALASVIYEF